MGEGGIRPLTPAFAAAITEACAKTGALFIADEVQSGLGRTGYPFYFKALGLQPHLVSVGKALGSGVPIGAALVSQEVADTISFGDHGSDLRRQPAGVPRGAVSSSTSWSAAGCSRTSAASARTSKQRLRAIAATHPIVKEVRGAGLMWGLELTRDAGAGRAGRPRARRRRQPDGGDGRPAAAAARHHGDRSGRGARPSRCGAGRRRSCRMKQPTGAGSRCGRRTRRTRRSCTR